MTDLLPIYHCVSQHPDYLRTLNKPFFNCTFNELENEVVFREFLLHIHKPLICNNFVNINNFVRNCPENSWLHLNFYLIRKLNSHFSFIIVQSVSNYKPENNKLKIIKITDSFNFNMLFLAPIPLLFKDDISSTLYSLIVSKKLDINSLSELCLRQISKLVSKVDQFERVKDKKVFENFSLVYYNLPIRIRTVDTDEELQELPEEIRKFYEETYSSKIKKSNNEYEMFKESFRENSRYGAFANSEISLPDLDITNTYNTVTSTPNMDELYTLQRNARLAELRSRVHLAPEERSFSRGTETSIGGLLDFRRTFRLPENFDSNMHSVRQIVDIHTEKIKKELKTVPFNANIEQFFASIDSIIKGNDYDFSS